MTGINTIVGTFDWTGGTLNGTLTVASNATLNVSGSGSSDQVAPGVLRAALIRGKDLT